MRKRRDGRGQTLVEFALIVPIFMLVTVGLIEGAIALFNYSTVSNAAREGARTAIVDQDTTAIQDSIEAAAVGLHLDRMTVTLDPCDDYACEYGVTVDYQYQAFFLGALFSPTLSSTVAMPVEHPNP